MTIKHFGTVRFKGTEYVILDEPMILVPNQNWGFNGTLKGYKYQSEWVAPGVDDNGNKVRITWKIGFVAGQEAETTTKGWGIPQDWTQEPISIELDRQA